MWYVQPAKAQTSLRIGREGSPQPGDQASRL